MAAAEIFPAGFAELSQNIYLVAPSSQIAQRLVRLEVCLSNRVNDPLRTFNDWLRGQNAHSAELDVKSDKFGHLRIIAYQGIAIQRQRLFYERFVEFLATTLVVQHLFCAGLRVLRDPGGA